MGASLILPRLPFCSDEDGRFRRAQRLIPTRRKGLKLSRKVMRLLEHALSEASTETAQQPQQQQHFHAIVADIWSAFRADSRTQSTATLANLSSCFARLAALLLQHGDEVLTAFELTTCGLVPALLLCLSVAHADYWSCPVSCVCGSHVIVRNFVSAV